MHDHTDVYHPHAYSTRTSTADREESVSSMTVRLAKQVRRASRQAGGERMLTGGPSRQRYTEQRVANELVDGKDVPRVDPTGHFPDNDVTIDDPHRLQLARDNGGKEDAEDTVLQVADIAAQLQERQGDKLQREEGTDRRRHTY